MSVIDTDYSSYAIRYSCNDDNWHGIRTDYVTILSRTPTISEELMTQIRDKVASQLPDYDMSNWQMWNTDQGDDYCTYDFNIWSDEN